MIKEGIKKLIEKKDLTKEEAMEIMNQIMDGEATPSQIASFITALRMKGETIEEITGFAITMRKKAIHIYPKREILVDTCGTGGDKLNTFNISTTSAFVVAGTGLAVAKHGNRSVSSQCGSADVLEELGINLEIAEHKTTESINEIGIGFLFAPHFHPAMKYAIGPRKEIGIRTVFNILGPLTNPANAKAQVLGVYDENLCETMAQVLNNLGVKHAFVVHGMCGLDEISTISLTKITEVKNGDVRSYTISPEDFGFKLASEEDIKGGTKKENAETLLNILKGKKGPKRDIVVLNAASAIVAGGLAKDLKEGIELAKESIDSGRALTKLELLKERVSP